MPEGHETHTSDGLSRKADAPIEQGVVKLPEWHGMAGAASPEGQETRTSDGLKYQTPEQPNDAKEH